MNRRTMPHRAVPIVLVALAALATLASGSARPSWQRSELRAPGGAGLAGEGPTAVQRGTGSGDDGGLRLDDGGYELTLGVVPVDGSASSGNQAVFLNRFTIPPDQIFTLDAVSMLIPVTSMGVPTNVRDGSTFEVLVYTDESGSGDPANTVFRARKTFAVRPSNTVFQDVALDLPIVVLKGDVWVGFTNTVTRSDNRAIFPGAVDSSSPNQNRSWIFFNPTTRDHFGEDDDGPLTNAEVGTLINQPPTGGNWLIRARGQAGGLTCVMWGAPSAGLVDGGLPPPQNTSLCDEIPPATDDPMKERTPRATLMGYNVYRSGQPGVQPTPENLFTSVPAGTTEVGSSVSPDGSFFVVTAVYDTGESGPSNELDVVPPTVNTLKVTNTKITALGTDFTDQILVFVDGVPFAAPAKVKKNGTKFVQKGVLVTGQTIGDYLAEHGNQARIDMRNARGAIRTVNFSR